MLSPDAGTVYVNTGNKVSNLYAFDVRTGKNKWTFRPTDNGDMQAESKSMVAVNPVSGDIYYGTSAGGQFYAVKPDGTLHWKFSKCGSMNSAPPAVSADGTVVYIADAKAISMRSTPKPERSGGVHPTRPAAAVTVCWSTAAKWS